VLALPMVIILLVISLNELIVFIVLAIVLCTTYFVNLVAVPTKLVYPLLLPLLPFQIQFVMSDPSWQYYHVTCGQDCWFQQVQEARTNLATKCGEVWG